MTFTAALRNAFSFRARQVTALALLLYTTVFVVLIVGNQLAAVPDDEAQRGLGLALEEAYEDLYTITARPHPYNSRENDRVRAHLLRRLNGIAQNHPFVHVVDDNTTSGFLDGSVVNYFQGNNVLVKVDGSEDQRNGDAILFSAHFDSVSTAPGATDDGMSVASLLQMVKYLANNRPRRTAIFNFNNGEEDGLHGAHSFIAHRWANITSTFVNFEGAGAGGRPFLFRANSLPILRAFSHSHIPHPHADAISADAFAMHVIRSETDYAVYAGPRSEPSFSGVKAADHGAYTGSGGGMRGADVAFIQHRSRYHTPEDSIRAMGHEGSRRALWASMETVRGAGAALLDAPEGGLSEDVVGDAEPATYFELFGTYLVAFPLRTLLAVSISLLVAGPIVLLIIGFYLYRQTLTLNGRWIMGFRGYGRFWLAFLISAGFQIGLVVGYLKLNPYTVHAHSVSVVASILSLSYLGFSIPLTIAQYVRPIPPAKQKFTILLELYFFTWLLLIGATILAGAKNISGLYWVMTWNTSALVAALLVMVEGLVGRGHGGREIVAPAASEDEGAEHHAGEEAEEDVSEQTPLIGRRLTPAAPTSSAVMLDETIQDRSPLWWILQMLFSIPVPAYQIGSLMLLWIQSMSQTTPDGGWAGIIYIPLSLVSILILLPLTPYVHKMHGLLTALVAIIFVACTLHAWFTWPFDTSGSRLKVWFTSHVELANLTTSSTPSVSLAAFTPDFVRAKTELSVVPGFLDLVVNELPSSRSGNITPTNGIEERRKGLQTRGWTVTPRWHPSVDPEGRWLEASAVRVNTTTAHFTIRGENTRSCRLSTHNRSIRRFRARSHKERKWTEYVLPEVPEPGVRELRLWSRTWDDAFEVEVEFKEEDSGAIEGQVSCAWAEYSGGWAAGIGAQPDVGCSAGVRIPALEEVLAFMPEWTVVSKIEDGLVTADSGFVLE